MVTCGFDVTMNIYQIHQEYNDGDLMGQLKGHTSLVCAMECIEGTPLVVSSDDKHIIKVWDVRTLKCIQTFDLELRQPIGRIINLGNINAICLVSSRILVCEFENCVLSMQHFRSARNKARHAAQTRSRQPLWPMKVEYNAAKQEMYICTRKDLRILDVRTGKLKKLIKGLLTHPEDEITSFATMQQHKKLMIGTQKGFLKIHDTHTGERINEFHAHQAEVSSISIDYSNQLVTTCSYDSAIYTWREKANGSINAKQREFKYEVLREITNAHFAQPVFLMEVSAYHNFIATASNHPSILLFDAEFSKLHCTLTLENQAEPTALAFINAFSLLAVADSHGNILLFHLRLDQETLLVTLQARINPHYKRAEVKEDKPVLVAQDSQRSFRSPTKRRVELSPLKKVQK